MQHIQLCQAEDCALKYDVAGRPYHHKDLSLWGCHLSRVVMLDNSPVVLQKLEPNAFFIADFFGKDDGDEQLAEAVLPVLSQLAGIPGDVRYFLCSLQGSPFEDAVDLTTEESCRGITQTFVNSLRFHDSDQRHRQELLREVAVEPAMAHFAASDNVALLAQEARSATSYVPAHQSLH